MLNKCQFIGRLGRDPETRSLQNGGKVCNFRLACSEIWKVRETGECKERTEWVSIAIFSEGLVRVAEQYLRKGSRIYVEGKLQTRKWQDQSGQDRYSTEVVLQGYDAKLVLLDSKGDRGERSDYGTGHGDGYGSGGRPSSDLDDEIPFAPEVLA